jgi:hypothetical protein
MGSIPGRVKTKSLKLVYAASLFFYFFICFSAWHTALKRKKKDCFTSWNQDNVSE